MLARRAMTGADGLLPALVKEALERGLGAELTEHLGYDKGKPTAQARGNARNGTHPRRWTRQDGAFRDLWSPGTGPGPSPHARVASRGQRRLDGLDASESPGLMRRRN